MRVRSSETVSESASERRRRRADDILDLQRAARGGGSDALLDWLAARTGAQVLLVAPEGVDDMPDLDAARQAVDEMRARGLDSLALDGGDHTVVSVALGRAREAGGSDGAPPVLVAVAPRPVPDGLPALLADASVVLDLCWRLERSEVRWRRLEATEARNREAVLHLLMNGHVVTARQIADLLEPALPDVMRFHVVESAPDVREEVARRCTTLAPDAWVVPCPVYHDHVLVLAPAAASALAPTLAEALHDCLVGVSDSVPLRDAALGYEQAFRALVTARGRADRWAAFAHRPDPVLVVGPELQGWARQLLAPLRFHQARRPQDPDSAELSVTTASWLAFSARAAALLKIHRNTVAARLRQVETLLDLDLDRLADQAVLALALRADAPRPGTPDASPAYGSSAPPVPPAPLDTLLARPAVVAWAHGLLQPLDDAGLGPTLDAWLRHDARLAPTAAELGISTTGVRKRLVRAEELLERPLLRPPSDRHELWLARRALLLAGRDTPALVPGPPASTVGSWLFEDGTAVTSADAALRQLRQRIAAGQLENWLSGSAGQSLGVISNTERAMVLLFDADGDSENAVSPGATGWGEGYILVNGQHDAYPDGDTVPLADALRIVGHILTTGRPPSDGSWSVRR